MVELVGLKNAEGYWAILSEQENIYTLVDIEGNSILRDINGIKTFDGSFKIKVSVMPGGILVKVKEDMCMHYFANRTSNKGIPFYIKELFNRHWKEYLKGGQVETTR